LEDANFAQFSPNAHQEEVEEEGFGKEENLL